MFLFKEQSWNNHSLHSPPLDLDVRLRRLDLSNNLIRQLHTLALPRLEHLNLSSNQLHLISEGAFENLTQLEELNLSRNALGDNLGSNTRALRSLGRLKTLDLSMNSLSDDAAELYLQNKSVLDHLKMTGNVLTRLSNKMFKQSENLRSIRIDDNLISVIQQGTFEPLIHLESLNLAQNNLVYICDFKLRQVKYLNLSRNSVEFFLTHEDNQSYRLEILDLSHNKLLYFPIIPKLNHLRYLYLQNNMIGTFKAEAAMVSEVNALYRDITRETTVTKNNFHSSWRQMPVIFIDLSYNHFTSFPVETLSFLSSLEMLNFSHNCLRRLMWNVRQDNTGRRRQLYFHALKNLDVRSNGLVHISPLFFNALRRIESLNLQDNAVQPCAPAGRLQNSSSGLQNLNASCVAFGKLKTLKDLNLKENHIQILHPNTFKETSLITLNLAGNSHLSIQEGALGGVQNTLQSLVISELNLSSDISFPCLPALTHLNISNNALDSIPSAFSCSPLRELDIRNNRFVSLNRSLTRVLSSDLRVMYVSGNSFNCCDSQWLTVLHERKVKVVDINSTLCFTSNTNAVLADIWRQTSLECAFHPEAREIHFGLLLVIVLFGTVILTALIIITRKLVCWCCAVTSPSVTQTFIVAFTQHKCARMAR